MKNDPEELNNLIDDTAHLDIVDSLKNELTELLKETKGNKISLLEERGIRFPWRKKEGAGQAAFPEYFFHKPAVK